MVGIAPILGCDNRVVPPIYPKGRIFGSGAAIRWPVCLRYVLTDAVAYQMLVRYGIVDVVIALVGI